MLEEPLLAREVGTLAQNKGGYFEDCLIDLHVVFHESQIEKVLQEGEVLGIEGHEGVLNLFFVIAQNAVQRGDGQQHDLTLVVGLVDYFGQCCEHLVSFHVHDFALLR